LVLVDFVKTVFVNFYIFEVYGQIGISLIEFFEELKITKFKLVIAN
jgi:hypothetical protein